MVRTYKVTKFAVLLYNVATAIILALSIVLNTVRMSILSESIYLCDSLDQLDRVAPPEKKALLVLGNPLIYKATTLYSIASTYNAFF